MEVSVYGYVLRTQAAYAHALVTCGWLCTARRLHPPPQAFLRILSTKDDPYVVHQAARVIIAITTDGVEPLPQREQQVFFMWICNETKSKNKCVFSSFGSPLTHTTTISLHARGVCTHTFSCPSPSRWFAHRPHAPCPLPPPAVLLPLPHPPPPCPCARSFALRRRPSSVGTHRCWRSSRCANSCDARFTAGRSTSTPRVLPPSSTSSAWTRLATSRLSTLRPTARGSSRSTRTSRTASRTMYVPLSL